METYPRVTPDQLTPEARALRETILSGPRSATSGQFPIEAADGSLEGPFGLFLFSPSIGAPLESLGARLRTASVLSPRQRELATLAVAARLDSEFELHAHLPLARAAGVDADEIDAVLGCRDLADPAEQALVAFCRANAIEVDPAPEFEELRTHFDRTAVFEIVVLVLYYRGLASLLALFAIRPPEISGPRVP